MISAGLSAAPVLPSPPRSRYNRPEGRAQLRPCNVLMLYLGGNVWIRCRGSVARWAVGTAFLMWPGTQKVIVFY